MSNLFHSFILGGFECATHLRRDGRRIDVIETSQHNQQAAEDYRLLALAGIRTVRDGLRWHLIETEPGVYDWSSFLPMLEASVQTGTQVIWDLCHWGVPDGLDVFSDEFQSRFAAFAQAAAELITARTEGIHFYCPINEISFWAWVGGDEAHFGPYARGRGPELKRKLVAASVAAIRAIREVDNRARFVQAEPLIDIKWNSKKPEDADASARHSEAQFEAFDLIQGTDANEAAFGGVGGSPEMLDIIGVNYYWNNQWVHKGEHTPPGHPLHVPLHFLLLRLWSRYRRPIVITETGAEGEAGIGWLGYIASEVRQAQRQGADIQGICLYPVMDYSGWDDDRHCRCGLIEIQPGWGARSLRTDLVSEVRLQLLATSMLEERKVAVS